MRILLAPYILVLLRFIVILIVTILQGHSRAEREINVILVLLNRTVFPSLEGLR